TGHHRVELQVARVDLRPPAPRFREDEFARLFEAPKPPENERSGTGKDFHHGDTEDTEKYTEGEPRWGALPPSVSPCTPPCSPCLRGESPYPPRPSARVEEEPAAEQESKPEPAAAPSPPEPVEIVFEGIRDRLRFLTPVSLYCAARRISPDGKQL